MIEDVSAQAYPAFPSHGGGFRVDAHFFELAHVAPQLEGADLEQVAEEHAALQPVLEPQPQLVVFLGLARGDSHGVVLRHGHSQLSAPPVWYSMTRVSK